jgi:hypothetical protein
VSSAIETGSAPRLTGERRPVMMLRAAGVLVLLCAAVGVVIAVMSAVRGAPADPNRPAFEVGIAHPAPTSFGIVAVEYAQFLGGPTLNALTGSNHNVGALVPPDKMQVEATVTITNFSKHTVDYSPTQFSLLVGNSTKPILVKHASTGDGTLQPDAGIDVRLTFQTGLSKKDMALRYVERDGSGPILMRLGHHTVSAQTAHGEKPGQVLGVGQTSHEHPAAADPASAGSTDHTHTNHP